MRDVPITECPPCGAPARGQHALLPRATCASAGGRGAPLGSPIVTDQGSRSRMQISKRPKQSIASVLPVAHRQFRTIIVEDQPHQHDDWFELWLAPGGRLTDSPGGPNAKPHTHLNDTATSTHSPAYRDRNQPRRCRLGAASQPLRALPSAAQPNGGSRERTPHCRLVA